MLDSAIKLCEVLGKTPEDLWSSEQLYPLERNFSEMEMSYEQVVAMLPEERQYYIQDFSKAESEQLTKLVGAALGTLTEREERVIRLRFMEGSTYEQVAKHQGVGAERIRQLEARALKKLQKPKCKGLLCDYADSVGEVERAEYKTAAKHAFTTTNL